MDDIGTSIAFHKVIGEHPTLYQTSFFTLFVLRCEVKVLNNMLFNISFGAIRMPGGMNQALQKSSARTVDVNVSNVRISNKLVYLFSRAFLEK